MRPWLGQYKVRGGSKAATTRVLLLPHRAQRRRDHSLSPPRIEEEEAAVRRASIGCSEPLTLAARRPPLGISMHDPQLHLLWLQNCRLWSFFRCYLPVAGLQNMHSDMQIRKKWMV
ncbi:unnamed protein product [Urochloa humidicola]